MEIRKILKKELSKSGGRAELVKVPPGKKTEYGIARQAEPGC